MIVNKKNGVRELSAAELEAIFSTGERFWSDGSAIAPFNLPPKTPLRAEFDRAVLRMDPDAISRFWIDRKVRGGAPPPRQVPDPDLMLRVVAKLESAIGYVPALAVNGSVHVVARIRDGKVVKR